MFALVLNGLVFSKGFTAGAAAFKGSIVVRTFEDGERTGTAFATVCSLTMLGGVGEDNLLIMKAAEAIIINMEITTTAI